MVVECFHCHELIPKGFKAELTITDEPRYFCCYGCLAIADTIVSGGLESFYQHRTQASVKPDYLSQSEQDELTLYDDPELQEMFVEVDQGSSSTFLSISGITCAACIWLLERELNQLSGIEFFSVNHSTHKAHLSWKTNSVKLSEILLNIRKLGYKAHPFEEDLARKTAKSEKQNTIFRIAVAGIASMQNMMFSIPLYLGIYSGIDANFIIFFRWVSLIMCTPVVLFSAFPFFKAALRDLKIRHLTMDTPVSLAIASAYFSSVYITILEDTNLHTDVYFDSVSMFTFFLLISRFLEMQARHQQMNNDADIHQLLPATALVKTQNGDISKQAHKIETGDILIIRQGQVAPADGIVIEGESRFDESTLTGEFEPIKKTTGSPIIGGTANIENTLWVETTAIPRHSRVASIIKLLAKAYSDKPKIVRLADQVASYFVITVLITSALVGAYWYVFDPTRAFEIVLSVLVVTCPCALSLATPTAMTITNNELRKAGLLITKSHALEAMNKVSDIIFDKTGTLTEGKLHFKNTETFHGISKEYALEIAAALEHHSQHPIAQAFKPYFKTSASKVSTSLGQGIEGDVTKNGPMTHYRLGNLPFMDLSCEQKIQDSNKPGLHLFLSSGHKLLAHFLLSDKLRDDSPQCVKSFQALGIKTHILSGDKIESVEAIANDLGISHFQAEQSPEQKLDYVKRLQREGKIIAMVGDGINDLPVLSGAALSIAMGEASDITKLKSDAILLNSHLTVLNQAFQTAKQTRKIIRQNITWAILYNLCMLPLAATGFIPPYFAALGMSVSSLLVVFNSSRLKQKVKSNVL